MQQRTAPNISIRALVIACQIALALAALYLMGLPAVWLIPIATVAALFRAVRFMGSTARESATGSRGPPADVKGTYKPSQTRDEPIMAIETPENQSQRLRVKTQDEQAVFEVLQKIIADYGCDVLDNSGRCERLIRERCEALTARTGIATRREATVLVTALNEGLPQRLAASGRTFNRLAISNHAAVLSETSGLDPAAAHFAVEGWATALGLHYEG
jgi:hypothetical protein